MKLSITAKFYTSVVVAAIGYVLIAGIELGSVYEQQIEAKEDKLKTIVDGAHTVAQGYYNQFKAGELSEDEAKKRAIEAVMSIRFDVDNYFWITDHQPVMVAHAVKPQLIGKNLSEFKDIKGKELFNEFIETVQASGEGYVDFYWVRDEKEGPVEKLAFVKNLDGWNWSMGTGIYIDDVKKVFYGKAVKLLLIIVVFLLILAAISYIVSSNVTKPLKSITSNMKKIIAGDLNFEVEKMTRDDEIGVLSESLQIFLDQAHEKEEVEKQRLEAQSLVDQEKAQMEEERKESVMELASHFENSVKSIVEQVSSALHELNAQANVSNQSAQDGAAKTEEATRLVTEMSVSVERVTDVTNIISNIADQTNLLALNAAIESARAGEAGRGFAVVADEVRKLASQTVEATVSITEQINAMEGAAHSSVSGIEVVDEIIKANGVGATEMLQAISDLTDQFEILDREATNFLEGLRHS